MAESATEFVLSRNNLFLVPEIFLAGISLQAERYPEDKL